MADDIVSPEGDASQSYNLRYGGPLDPAGEGDIGFASPASNEANSLPPGAQEFQRDLQHLLGQGDRQSVVSGKRVSARVDIGGHSDRNKKQNETNKWTKKHKEVTQHTK